MNILAYVLNKSNIIHVTLMSANLLFKNLNLDWQHHYEMFT
jgi:hypothetical protein